MNKTIQVVPYRVGIDLNGRKCSMFSAGLARVDTTDHYTWRVHDHNGRMTEGLCRTPATTRAEADKVAANIAKLRGYAVIN